MRRIPMKAFTLIELLVVIAILAIMAAILFPVFARAREKARQTTCISNQKQIGTAVLMYTQDYDETFPFVLNFSANFMLGNANIGDNGKVVLPGFTGQEPQFQLVTVVAPYVKNNIWYCPSVGPDYAWEVQYRLGAWKRGATMRDQGTSYAYTYTAWPRQCWQCPGQVLLGGKSLATVREPARWPMVCEEPGGIGYTGSLGDPPSSAAPHFGGWNIAFGDGHVKYHRMEVADNNWLNLHAGDGVIPGQ